MNPLVHIRQKDRRQSCRMKTEKSNECHFVYCFVALHLPQSTCSNLVDLYFQLTSFVLPATGLSFSKTGLSLTWHI